MAQMNDRFAQYHVHNTLRIKHVDSSCTDMHTVAHLKMISGLYMVANDTLHVQAVSCHVLCIDMLARMAFTVCCVYLQDAMALTRKLIASTCS